MKQFLRRIRAWSLRPISNETLEIQTQLKSSNAALVTLQQDVRSLRSSVVALEALTKELVLHEAEPVLNEIETFLKQKQLNFTSTLEMIRDNKMSFTRFGDGELKLMLRPTYNLRFQPYDPLLAEELKRVFAADTTNGNLLVGFPTLYKDLHWSRVWMDLWKEVKKLVPEREIWGNSHVSRPICFQELGIQGVNLWREIWQDRDVVIVTGVNSRMELIPELFNNVRRIDHVGGEPINAFSHLTQLHQDLNPHLSHGKLFLIALGPTGTVLSAQLSELGEQAVDIGHISDSYQTVFEGEAWPESKPVLRTHD